ncbi:Cytochrome b561 and DOMON domain-containing protein [Drosera capensis]
MDPRMIISLLLVLCFPFTTLSQSTSTCSTAVTFSNKKSYTTCTALPVLSSTLYWTYSPATGTADIAFSATGITSSNWVAWALNPSGSGMGGSQALVAYKNSSGAIHVYTSSVASNSASTELTQSALSFDVTNLAGEMTGSQMVIFGTVTLPGNETTLNQVWQVGPLSGESPAGHDLDSAHTSSSGTVNFLTGTSTISGSGASTLRKKNTHGVLNAVSWGTMMPLGAMIARYVKVFEIGNPAWFYLHVACQASAYIVGVAGFGTGLNIGTGTYHTHRDIGIALFSLGTLQVFALLLRPKPDHKYRFHWNIYHHSIGYTVIILSIVNVFKGLDILDPAKKWKKAYIGILIFLGSVALVLEAVKWLMFLKKKRSPPSPLPEDKDSYTNPYGNGNNGVNGYRSHPAAV